MAKKRMLIIVNPYATTVSDRLRNLVVYALQGRFEVEAISTRAQNHATEIGRDAANGNYDIVVAFGGDGTLNEVANGVAGTDVPVSVLPGGSTNVVARTLGIPNDVVDATEHLLSLADDFKPRKIDLGMIDDRYFVFSCGMGIDATVVERVDAHPKLKAKAGPYYYSWAALAGYYRGYLADPIRMRLEADGQVAEGVTVLAQNSDPYTYFAKTPIRVCEDVANDDGSISIAVLKRAAQRDIATLVPRLLSDRMKTASHRQIEILPHISRAVVSSISADEHGATRAFPVQIDGDYIGTRKQVRLAVAPGALTIVA